MRVLFTVLAPLCLLWPLTSRCEVDLALALAKVYAEHPQLLAARAELRGTDEALVEARAGTRPKLVARSGTFLRQLDTGSKAQSLITLDESIALSQTLWDGGRTAAKLAGSEAAIEAGRASLEQLTQEVLLEAVQAFAAVVRDQQILERALAIEQRLQTELAAARQRYRLGEASRTDVAQAEARWAAARAERRRAEGQLEISGAAYRRVIGDPPGSLKPPEPPPGLPETLDVALATLTAHPAYLAAREAERRAAADVDAARAELRPRLEFAGSYGLTREAEAGEGFRAEASVGAVLTWPLYQGGAEYARLRRGHQLQRAARLRLLETERRLREEVVAAFEALRSAREALEAIAVQERAAALAVDGLRRELQAGTRTTTDLLDAEEELFEAERAAIQARFAEVVAGYRLLAAMGQLQPERLGLRVERYDPTLYTRAVRDAWLGGAPPEVETPAPVLDESGGKG